MSSAKSEGTSTVEGGNYRRGMGLTPAKPGLVVLCLLQRDIREKWVIGQDRIVTNVARN